MGNPNLATVQRGKSKFKKAIGWLHLWLGIGSGLIVILLGLTGCLFVFQKEISAIVYRKQINVAIPNNTTTLPLSRLSANAEKALGDSIKIGFITAYKDQGKAWEFGAYKEGNRKAFWYLDAVGYYYVAHVNPYNGQVTGIKNYKYDFFTLVKMLHWSLLINHPVGQQLIAWSTFIFTIMLITGLVLWWPKNLKKANFDKSFKIKWKAKFKRLNYDLHSVPGFYTLLISLILALTGMLFAFEWLNNTVYAIASLNAPKTEHKNFTSDTTKLTQGNGLDIAFETAKKAFATKDRISIAPATEKAAPIYATGYVGQETYYHYDELQIDQYSGKILSRSNYASQNAGEKLSAMNYDIHVGAILGLPGKVVAFFASFVAMTLPISGFIIWRGRKKKQAKPLLNLSS
jgi:uncharacterized iron-regulated membrane protein